MAVTITRTAWTDDDGSGTTGTVINNAAKTSLYDQIDTALALLLPLAGGTVSGPIVVSDTTDASSSTTGSVKTAGGLGVAKNLFVGTGLNLNSLTASVAVFTDASKNLVSNAITGTGNVVMSASPTLTGTIAGAAMTLSSTLGVSGVLSALATTDASSSSTGALVVSGGVGFAANKQFYMGDSYVAMRSDSNFELHVGAQQYFLGNAVVELPPAYTSTSGAAANVVVTSGGALARSTSSLRYKTDVQPFTGGLSDLLQLQPISFAEKKDPNGPRFLGFVAEDVDKAGLTLLVNYDEQGRPDALQYERLTTYIVNALKELSDDADALKTKVGLPVTHKATLPPNAASKAKAVKRVADAVQPIREQDVRLASIEAR